MKTLLHLTSDDENDWGHAIRSASLLIQHKDLPHENVTLLPHRYGIGIVIPASPFVDQIRDILDLGVTVNAGKT